MAMIHQRFLLFPHLTAAENVAFGMPYHGVRRSEQSARVAELLKLVGLDGFEKRYPRQLSGGQQQRVAIARALATHPRVLLLDEPLNSLDMPIRERLLDELRALHARSGMTMLYVTHDQSEAARIADRVALLEGGRILQIGPYEALRDRPASAAVARVLALRNLLPAERQAGRLRLPTLDLDLPWPDAAVVGPLLAYLPPDRLSVGVARTGWIAFDAVIEEIVPLPHAMQVRLRRGVGRLDVILTRAALDDSAGAVGSSLIVSVPSPAIHLLPAADPPAPGG
jgi:ABC-type sulfate/molybdate transport systems ATPase subunit